MTSFRDHVPLPPLGSFNQGLTPCLERTMLAKFGRPGDLTRDCSDPTGDFVRRVRNRFNVGPFKATGLDYAVESLLQIFGEVKGDNSQLFEQVKSDGMLCVRARRHNPAVYSNHSWGTAIDLYFGPENDIDQGTHLAMRGVLLLLPYFNRHGWFWGGGFSGDSVDSMHFELADETIRRVPEQPLFMAPADVAADEEEAIGEAGVAAAAGIGEQPQKLGDVCDEWDYNARQCAHRVDVWQRSGTKACYFMSKLAVDADGAPRAYHPDDKRPPDNSAKAFDWLANLSEQDRHGIQGADGVGPAPGFIVSATSLQNHDFKVNDTRRYVDASTIPYIVLPPSSLPVPAGTDLTTGCIAFVVDSKTGMATGAIFADVGRAVGEGSIALALRLGLKPSSKKTPPKVVGFDEKRFIYIVFPNVTVPPPWPVPTIQASAEAAFQGWGGEPALRAAFPRLPALQPPAI